MLRIQRSTDGKHVVFALSGRIEAEDVAELQKLFQSEAKDHNLVLDLKDVRLVNRDALRSTVESVGATVSTSSSTRRRVEL